MGHEKAYGLCWQGEGLIELDTRVTPKFFARVAVHEILHELENSWTENKVDKTAKIIVDVLWDLGFKRVYDENKLMNPRQKRKNQKSSND